MVEGELHRVYNHPVYPRVSKITPDRELVSLDNGQMGGTH